MNLIQGVGVNDAPYAVDVKGELPRVDGKRKRYQIFLCPFYSVWREMLRRAYDKNFHSRKPSYSNVEVCDEWLRFMNFRAWMTEQNWEGKHLDKDVIGTGLLYSPENCVFITQRVNKFVIGESKSCGVYTNKSSFVAKGKNFNGKSIHLGSFQSWDAARLSYIKHKISQIEYFHTIGEITDNIRDSLMTRYKAA